MNEVQLIKTVKISAAGELGGEPNQHEIDIVFDERNGKTVYVRPVRPGETSEGVWVNADDNMVIRVEVTHAIPPGEQEPIRVVPD